MAKSQFDVKEIFLLAINLRHLMDFGNGTFEIEVLNNGKIVQNMTELVDVAGEYV